MLLVLEAEEECIFAGVRVVDGFQRNIWQVSLLAAGLVFEKLVIGEVSNQIS